MDLKDKVILIIGGNGLLGHALRAELDFRGIRYFAPSSEVCNVLDIDSLHGSFGYHQPDVVFNLFVSFGGIEANERHPGSIFRDNLQGNINVIEKCREFKVEKLIQLSSQCAYSDTQSIPFKESEIWSQGLPTKNNSPYGISKRVLHIMLEAYKEEFGLNSVILIPSNMYGPYDNFHPSATHVIPSLIRRLTEAKEADLSSVEIWGTGNSTREFLYTMDAARALVLAAENYNEVIPVNIGSGQEVSIKYLAETIAGLVGYKGQLVYNNNGKDGQRRRCSDVSLAKEKFKFEVRTMLINGLKDTIEYFNKNRDRLRQTKIYE